MLAFLSVSACFFSSGGGGGRDYVLFRGPLTCGQHDMTYKCSSRTETASSRVSDTRSSVFWGSAQAIILGIVFLRIKVGVPFFFFFCFFFGFSISFLFLLVFGGGGDDVLFRGPLTCGQDDMTKRVLISNQNRLVASKRYSGVAVFLRIVGAIRYSRVCRNVIYIQGGFFFSLG